MISENNNKTCSRQKYLNSPYTQVLKGGPQIALNAKLSPSQLLVYWMILDQMEFKKEWN